MMLTVGVGSGRRHEVRLDELAQIEVRAAARRAVIREHLFRRFHWQGVDEALAVRVDPLQLHALEQLAIDLGRRRYLRRVRQASEAEADETTEQCLQGIRGSGPCFSIDKSPIP